MKLISTQELATILAALRYYQEKGLGDPANRSADIHEIATDGDEVISLDANDIDDLCERLNGCDLVVDVEEEDNDFVVVSEATLDEWIEAMDLNNPGWSAQESKQRQDALEEMLRIRRTQNPERE